MFLLQESTRHSCVTRVFLHKHNNRRKLSVPVSLKVTNNKNIFHLKPIGVCPGTQQVTARATQRSRVRVLRNMLINVYTSNPSLSKATVKIDMFKIQWRQDMRLTALMSSSNQHYYTKTALSVLKHRNRKKKWNRYYELNTETAPPCSCRARTYQRVHEL